MVFRLALSLSAALVLSGLLLTPFGQRMEQSYGLGLLYTLRGTVEAPGEALIIALDSNSIGWLQRNVRDLPSVAEGLDTCLTPHALDVIERSRNVNLVPRALYVCLLERLSPLGPHTIALDVKFNAERPDDLAFAQALARAGNVLLLEGIGGADLVTRTRAAKVLREAAAASAMFQSNGVDGSVATGYAVRHPAFPSVAAMPVLAWQRYTLQTDQPADPFQPVSYYGPPQTVRTLSLRAVFETGASAALPTDLSDKVVFVGVSDAVQPSAQDHFRMPMPLGRADLIAGVEIAATAFLNLVHGQTLSRPGLGAEMALVAACLAAMLVLSLSLQGIWGLLAAPVIGLGYLAGSTLLFAGAYIWVPVFLPIAIGVPVSLAAAQLLRYARARDIIRRLVPHQIADKWLREVEVQRGTDALESATIMFIDLAGSTRLGETLAPKALEQVLSVYYDGAAQAIESRDGMITEFKGDGVLAIFNESIAGRDHAQKACAAAIDVSSRVQTSGRAQFPEIFHTVRLRFGIHSGQVAMGVIGSRERFNFNALGDSMNVAARIEQYGKTLGDDGRDIILLSGETRDQTDLPDAMLEAIAKIRLRGRREETRIFRLI